MTARFPLDGQLRAVTLPDGTRAAVLDLVPPEGAPQAVREGLARRAIVNGGGTCPCGARLILPNRVARRRARGVLRVVIEHEHGCPATDEALHAALGEAGP